jgi:hypothetical protein
VAGSLGVLGVAVFATPAHAAPATINTDQVLAIAIRVTHAPNQRGAIGIELRSGTYNADGTCLSDGIGYAHTSGWLTQSEAAVRTGPRQQLRALEDGLLLRPSVWCRLKFRQFAGGPLVSSTFSRTPPWPGAGPFDARLDMRDL